MSQPPGTPITVLLADDHEIVLQGLRTMLSNEPRIRLVALAKNGAEAVEQHKVHHPDITLLDIRMPEVDGIEALAAIKKASPKARVIMFAAEDFQADVLQAWQLGAAGFMLKTTSRVELVNAIESAHTLGWCHPFQPGKLPQGARGEAALSPRELEVLDYVRRGLSNADIAVALSITEHTIKAHLKMIFLKLGCADRTEAVVAALERGLLRLSPNHTEARTPPQKS